MVRSQSDRPPGSPSPVRIIACWFNDVCHAERSRDRGGVVLYKEPFRHVNRLPDDLFFAFVLCQGESGSGASLGACNRDSSMWRCRFLLTIAHCELLSDSVVRPMSDRESVRDGNITEGTSTSGSEGSEARV